MMPVKIPVSRIAKVCNPFECPWVCIPFGRQQVTACIRAKSYEAFDIPVADDTVDFRPHANRIAYLVKHGWLDAIEIEVGIPSLQCHVDWMVEDGNHRLAAAIYRKDKDILARVGGDLDYAFELFGVDCQEPVTAE